MTWPGIRGGFGVRVWDTSLVRLWCGLRPAAGQRDRDCSARKRSCSKNLLSSKPSSVFKPAGRRRLPLCTESGAALEPAARRRRQDPGNYREALREALADEAEGADIMMVKPGLPYLDIIRLLRDNSALPIAAYHVSGAPARPRALEAAART